MLYAYLTSSMHAKCPAKLIHFIEFDTTLTLLEDVV
jgi:hypothetical protein